MENCLLEKIAIGFRFILLGFAASISKISTQNIYHQVARSYKYQYP
jgi:hypothetical protein